MDLAILWSCAFCVHDTSLKSSTTIPSKLMFMILAASEGFFRTLKKILDGRIKICPGDWATFLYAEDAYNPDEPDEGLLRGYFLLRVRLSISSSSLLMFTIGYQAYFYWTFFSPTNYTWGKEHSSMQCEAPQDDTFYGSKYCLCGCAGTVNYSLIFNVVVTNLST